jgi:predicted enzyme related to lactoylglutathione lyase
MPAGSISGVTLSAAPGVIGFYGELFGWELADGVLVGSDGVPLAAFVSGADGWSPTLLGPPENVIAAGGRIFAGGFATDSCGVRFGFGPVAVGLPEAGPGRPAWFEHQSNDAAAADRFYPSVFDWAVEPAGAEYATFTARGRPVAGRLATGPELSTALGQRWMVHLAHADVDAGASDVERCGGTVVAAPRDAPTGRLATVTDPGGAVFTLLTPAVKGIERPSPS